MIEAIADFVGRNCARLLGSETAARGLRVVKTSFAHGLSGRAKFFVFYGTERAPRLVCTVARHPSGEERLREEWRTRSEIAGRLPSTLKASVPAIVAMERIEGALVLVEQGVAGGALSVPSAGWVSARRRRRLEGELARLAGWLRGFQNATHVGWREWTAGDEEERVTGPFESVFRWLPAGGAVRLGEKLCRLVKPLRGERVRWVAGHGDLWPGNVLVRGGQIVLVDWERARTCAPSFADPFTFALLCGRSANGGHEPARWARMAVRRFLSTTLAGLEMGVAARAAGCLASLAAHCAHSNPEAVPPALPLLLRTIEEPGILGWLGDGE